ncbi:MAG: phosphate/phosphite/phosphonate ABC transporter substrate-binding protein [Gammaproteobacteria bacterium]
MRVVFQSVVAMMLLGLLAPAHAASGPGLVFAVHPYDTPSRLVSRFQPICDYLGAQLNRPVELYITTSYEDQVRKIAKDEVDIAYMGPSPYLRAHDRYAEGERRVQLVAAEPPYQGAILVRRDSGIREIGDLAGKPFAFGAYQSFAGHYMPRAIMMKAEITLADLKDYSFLGRHERVVLSVLHGDFDAGATARGIAEKYLDRDPGLRILAITPPLPPLAIVARPGLDADTVKALRQALVDPELEGIEALRSLGEGVSFQVIEDREFDAARAVVELVERGCLPCSESP